MTARDDTDGQPRDNLRVLPAARERLVEEDSEITPQASTLPAAGGLPGEREALEAESRRLDDERRMEQWRLEDEQRADEEQRRQERLAEEDRQRHERLAEDDRQRQERLADQDRQHQERLAEEERQRQERLAEEERRLEERRRDAERKLEDESGSRIAALEAELARRRDAAAQDERQERAADDERRSKERAGTERELEERRQEAARRLEDESGTRMADLEAEIAARRQAAAEEITLWLLERQTAEEERLARLTQPETAELVDHWKGAERRRFEEALTSEERQFDDYLERRLAHRHEEYRRRQAAELDGPAASARDIGRLLRAELAGSADFVAFALAIHHPELAQVEYRYRTANDDPVSRAVGAADIDDGPEAAVVDSATRWITARRPADGHGGDVTVVQFPVRVGTGSVGVVTLQTLAEAGFAPEQLDAMASLIDERGPALAEARRRRLYREAVA